MLCVVIKKLTPRLVVKILSYFLGYSPHKYITKKILSRVNVKPCISCACFYLYFLFYAKKISAFKSVEVEFWFVSDIVGCYDVLFCIALIWPFSAIYGPYSIKVYYFSLTLSLCFFQSKNK